MARKKQRRQARRLKRGDDWPEEFPAVPRPTAENPIVPAIPPGLKQYLDQLQGLGWWFGTDLFLVLCGHAFDEEVISRAVEIEAPVSSGLNFFVGQAWSRANKQLEEDIELLKQKYVCFKETQDDDCTLTLKAGPVTVEAADGAQWKPLDRSLVTTKIRLGFPKSREVYFVRVRAKATVRIACKKGA